uniref:ARAD1D47322p n=1 Tax=Blastobotrys adeninivorans TaxID=409370 RepID=A0A060TD15_BLAAD
MSGTKDNEDAWSQLPTGFGKQQVDDGTGLDARYERVRTAEYIQRLEKLKLKENASKGDSESESESESDEENDVDDLPTTHELILDAHSKTVTSVSLDPSGTYLATGSTDGQVKLWNYNTMDVRLKTSFREIEGNEESHPIKKVKFSPKGDTFLVVPDTRRAQLFARDGWEQIGEYVEGDMYLVDMKNTKGHIAPIVDASWNPTTDSTFATAARDGTVRVWDSANFRSQKSVIVLRTTRGSKAEARAVSYSHDGKKIFAANSEGTLTVWDANGPFLRPSATISAAHTPESSVSAIACFDSGANGDYIVTRSDDSTIKLWDSRNFKQPLLQRSNLSGSERSGVAFSPDGRFIVGGSLEGNVHIMDRNDLTDIQTISVGSAVTDVLWHPKANQIVVGSGNGKCTTLFSREKSVKGAKMVIEKTPRSRQLEDSMTTTDISLHGLSEAAYDYQETQKEKSRQSHRSLNPDKPNEGVWGTPDPEHVRKNVPLSSMVHEDPREELLKYAKKAEEERRSKRQRTE